MSWSTKNIPDSNGKVAVVTGARRLHDLTQLRTWLRRAQPSTGRGEEANRPAAAELVRDGETLIVDAGTSTVATFPRAPVINNMTHQYQFDGGNRTC